MGKDIGQCLSFRAVCFGFRSTNVGSSVIGTRLIPVLMSSPFNYLPQFYPKTFQGLLFCFLGHSVGRNIFELFASEAKGKKKCNSCEELSHLPISIVSKHLLSHISNVKQVRMITHAQKYAQVGSAYSLPTSSLEKVI